MLVISRSSRPEVFCKKGFPRNFTKLTGTHLCQSLFLNKVAGLRPSTLFKKKLAQVFSCEFCKISKNTFLHRTPLVAVSEYQSSSSNYWVNEVVKTWSKWWSERICECTVLVYLVEVTVLSVIFFLCLSTQSFRSSCPKVFFRKIVPRNFAKFTGKHLCQVSFLIKLSAEACNFIIRETLVHSLELH